jgi:hypothetical protein
LKQRFGAKKEALKQLGSAIETSWDDLGALANAEPSGSQGTAESVVMPFAAAR